MRSQPFWVAEVTHRRQAPSYPPKRSPDAMQSSKPTSAPTAWAAHDLCLISRLARINILAWSSTVRRKHKPLRLCRLNGFYHVNDGAGREGGRIVLSCRALLRLYHPSLNKGWRYNERAGEHTLYILRARALAHAMTW